MKITHYVNSFVTVKEKNTVIACDPWIGFGSENGWLSYPIYKNGNKILETINPKYIYISHLHCDHLDKINLKRLKDKKVNIIIKKFKNKRLKFKLLQLGFKNIIECDEWKKYILDKNISIAIIPQMTTNSSNKEDSVNYDLDTSIVIQSNFTKKIFYNNVDNPLSLNDLKKVKNFVTNEFKNNIDICCFPAGAAGEYPQCFMNINRIKEKNKIIKSHLRTLAKQVKVLNVKNFFHAGGIFTIYGKFNSLNSLIATPNEQQISNIFNKLKINYYNILGGNSLDFKNNKFKKDISFKLNFPPKEKIIQKSKNIKYFYERNSKKFEKEEIDSAFRKAKKNYFKILKNFRIESSWKIDFWIYNKLTLNKYSLINKKKSKFIKKYSLNFMGNKKKFSHLKCYLDDSLFMGMLEKKFPWNPAIAGSVVMFERKPNVFDPSLTNSLNFLNYKL